MDYNPLSLYLEKFKKILNQTSFQKDTIISIISSEIKYEVKKENVKIKNNIVLFSNISPILKNEIFIHKEKILKQLKDIGINITELR